jgi:hypothetical protein
MFKSFETKQLFRGIVLLKSYGFLLALVTAN